MDLLRVRAGDVVAGVLWPRWTRSVGRCWQGSGEAGSNANANHSHYHGQRDLDESATNRSATTASCGPDATPGSSRRRMLAPFPVLERFPDGYRSTRQDF